MWDSVGMSIGAKACRVSGIAGFLGDFNAPRG
jgi:hypothetical protein